MSPQWEEKDFIWKWPQGSRVRRYTTSIVQTRYDIWMDVKPYVLKGLQKEIDDGWEPIGTIDQSGLRWRTYKEVHVEPMSIIMCFFLVGFLLVLMDLASPNEFEEVTEFRWPMHRPKTS